MPGGTSFEALAGVDQARVFPRKGYAADRLEAPHEELAGCRKKGRSTENLKGVWVSTLFSPAKPVYFSRTEKVCAAGVSR
ncbi:MAG: hypothetical protein A2374_01890 [Candidatus Moranbacteria bacterium RIFOXYB1_FULL_44_23]|nr:MAG: hypothetical protein A2194_03455 [Candidatus Moranbacteria bacterium RIFOXYA1_FULL_44_8]OGI40764.1 MAG: hypothetical protein A2374_01890 [Candidatus Moranbacteria bacterium RIFOXYB1_FULL_44_23]OGI42316.1 MAG: hypothetical protein A2593_04405 [Candidatus Moranbacteria bacterium RIFOXYD1_FULL_44_9]HBB37006.1 hypothetical protein [Candidatus Moranbacteria bacterium]HBU24981.1 hypothetical protein [Candidatus Moranbacteria bacterium]